MRITNSMMTNNFLNNLNTNMAMMERYQYQLATNKRMVRLSDDPTGIISSMQARVKLYRIEQYQTNVDTAKTWLTQTETALKEMNNILTSSYEYTVQAANSYLTADEKIAIAEVIKQYRDHALDLGNSKLGDRFLFGGYNTLNAPFTIDNNGDIFYNGLDLSTVNQDLLDESEEFIQFEIGYGMLTDAAIPGTKFMGMGQDNIYNVLDELYDNLMNDADPDVLAKSITKLQNCSTDILATTAEIGGKSTRLDLMENRYEDDFINYTEMKSKVEDAKQAEVIMYFKMAESVYLSALNAGSKIIQPSLLDYMR
ncbi:flagellar hook-associated protein FlgL [Clostridia bacterium OttesenSCG-928-F22]|nr:flagellar hook-associated protein FlgL [Clostridia bacterium OttesenSCG-928-F22]